ncbi:MAG: hypothetical protein HYS65_02770 [Betaproteobacteria bacterium]|nr:hypothetical protein [Betaproteobacteria bacterium]
MVRKRTLHRKFYLDGAEAIRLPKEFILIDGKVRCSWAKCKSAWTVVCRLDHLKATGGVALLVGTWLTLVNQADVIATRGFDIAVLVKVIVNYLTPFVVSNAGLLARND